MPVYQPSAVVGNSRMLATLGSKGELMSFFYPHIDFPQNLHEGMPALYLGAPGGGKLSWTFEPSWQADHSYEPKTNIVTTRLRRSDSGLEAGIVDLVHPHRQLLARHFTVANHGKSTVQGVLYQYFDPQLGEVQARNAVRFLRDRNTLTAYWRNICLAAGGDTFDQWHCGKRRGSSAKKGMAEGRLARHSEEIGDVDMAVGWEFRLRPGETLERLLLIGAASNEMEATHVVQEAQAEGWQSLHDAAARYWQERLAHAVTPSVDQELQAVYERCLLVLPLLFDAEYGAFLAAPEFDSEFERSGGYGYCWPRDAAEVVMALVEAGCPDLAEPFFAWAARVQAPDGHWEQRYWLSGERGPSWCTFEDAVQIDETAAVLVAMEKWAESLGGAERVQFAQKYWQTVQRGANYLTRSLGDNGLHKTGFDIWETLRGSFTYSNAAICAALRAAAYFADVVGDTAISAAWRPAADRVKAALIRAFWTGEGFACRLDEHGALDKRADSSVLGLVDPLDVLDLDNEEERIMAEKTVESLLKRLAAAVPGGVGLRRFEGDAYLGGAPGCVNTLWLSRVLLRLALHYDRTDQNKAQTFRQRALKHLKAAASCASPAGLLPEMMTEDGGWAAPHAWASASWITNMMLLHRINRAGGVSVREADRHG